MSCGLFSRFYYESHWSPFSSISTPLSRISCSFFCDNIKNKIYFLYKLHLKRGGKRAEQLKLSELHHLRDSKCVCVPETYNYSKTKLPSSYQQEGVNVLSVFVLESFPPHLIAKSMRTKILQPWLRWQKSIRFYIFLTFQFTFWDRNMVGKAAQDDNVLILINCCISEFHLFLPAKLNGSSLIGKMGAGI